MNEDVIMQSDTFVVDENTTTQLNASVINWDVITQSNASVTNENKTTQLNVSVTD